MDTPGRLAWRQSLDAAEAPWRDATTFKGNLKIAKPDATTYSLRAQHRPEGMATLQALTRYAWEHAPFYRRKWDEAGFHPDHLRTLEDFETKVPVITKRDLRDAQTRVPPFGDYLCVADDEARLPDVPEEAEADAKAAHAEGLEHQAHTRRSDAAAARAEVNQEFKRADKIDPDSQDRDPLPEDSETSITSR